MSSDKRYGILLAGFDKLASKIKSIDLSDESAAKTIQKITVIAKNAKEEAMKVRDEEIEPFDKAYKDVWDRWQLLISGFEMMFTKMKLLGLDTARKQKLATEQARAAAESDLQVARAAEKANVEIVDGKVVESNSKRTLSVLRKARATLDAIPERTDTVKTVGGSLFARRAWKWRPVNLDLVPDQYIQRQVDVARLDMAIHNGVRDIPGIEIYEEETAVSRRAK